MGPTMCAEQCGRVDREFGRLRWTVELALGAVTPCRHLEARGTGSPARGRVGYGGVAAAICAPTTSPLPPRCLPPTPHPGSDESRTQNNTRAAPAVARPSSNLSLFLPPSLLGEKSCRASRCRLLPLPPSLFLGQIPPSLALAPGIPDWVR
ncbi:hypothetical protein PVAP13_3KG241700 [Panicum virgatum]|uniref:Uncharacterized protein n=1 Tax=Panicum virgatum TaxID=38727 RepID=A0A8T0V7D6_PANVG|nr:hypothetical protein PVAP13_3KG241700 [Panicum virgatum]